MWKLPRALRNRNTPLYLRLSAPPTHLSSRVMSTSIDAFLTTSTKTDAPELPFKSQALWNSSRPKNESKPGESKIFYDVDGNGALAAVVSLGSAAEKPNAPLALKNEAVRKAVAVGVKKLKESGAKEIAVDVSSIDAQAAGVHPSYSPI